MTVGQALVRRAGSDLVFVGGDMNFSELLKRYTHSSQACFPIVDDDQKLTGVIDAADIRRIITETGVADLIIARDIERPATTVTEEDSLLAAVNNLVQADDNELVVVTEKDPTQITGILSRGDIIAAYNRQIIHRA